MHSIKNLFLLSTALILTSCASVQSVLNDKPKYVNDHLRIDKLEKETLQIIGEQQKFKQNFTRIVAHYKVISKDLEGKKDTSQKRTYTIDNIGDGYSRFDIEDFSNDVKFHEKFQLVYGGKILPLITRSFYLNQTNILEVNPIFVTKLDYKFGGIAEKKPYTIEYYGKVIGKYKLDCSSDKFYPASNINKSIPGLAIDIKCDTYINSIKTNTETYIFFKEFNLTMFSSLKSRRGEFRVEMTSFTSE